MLCYGNSAIFRIKGIRSARAAADDNFNNMLSTFARGNTEYTRISVVTCAELAYLHIIYQITGLNWIIHIQNAFTTLCYNVVYFLRVNEHFDLITNMRL